MSFVIVFLGAGIGGTLRYGAGLLSQRLFGDLSFPVATLSINVLGSLIMGYLLGLFSELQPDVATQNWRLFLTVGLLGGFTTFSAFSAETLGLITQGAWFTALAYILGSVLLSLLAVFAGLWVNSLL